MNLKTIFNSKNLYSLASRERCVTNMKRIAMPQLQNPPKKKASVMIAMCEIEDVISLLYTVKIRDIGTNNGFVGFPGGQSITNESVVQTALRKTHEETGLPPSKIELWGVGVAIPDFDQSVMVTPVLGVVEDLKTEHLKINEKKVSEAFAVPIEELCKHENHYHTQFKNEYILPVFLVDDHKIWGLTAYLTHMYLNSLLPKTVYTNDWASKKVSVARLDEQMT